MNSIVTDAGRPGYKACLFATTLDEINSRGMTGSSRDSVAVIARIPP